MVGVVRMFTVIFFYLVKQQAPELCGAAYWRNKFFYLSARIAANSR